MLHRLRPLLSRVAPDAAVQTAAGGRASSEGRGNEMAL